MEAGPRNTGRDDARRDDVARDEAADGSGREAEPMLQDGLGLPAEPARLTPDGPDADPDADGSVDVSGPEVEVELRPQRRLRIWQIAPIVMLAAAGSLMFAFPLAFEFGDGGAVVAMLGLLISCCAGGWGMMAARRVGYTWPGLPPRGSGRRPDWRIAALYALVVLALAALAIWRVARLRP
ncbi:hypothetical protein [Streptomyces bambusae]|uniref:Transmembrane protein n=1 Tax=Streptomyces bambusae TaxID=1550616 RepID=A0ABS6Z9L6_9ACTN|nr:hypothetical protein [Streptomyces bambusae]MBW5484459.1 hypothetical protein [Streptomyces bambusae]